MKKVKQKKLIKHQELKNHKNKKNYTMLKEHLIFENLNIVEWTAAYHVDRKEH